jgi:transposase
VERLFAWLQWFRRLVTRYEFYAENFRGMVRLLVPSTLARLLPNQESKTCGDCDEE